MPKLIGQTELEIIEKIVARYPNGVRLDELLKSDGFQLSHRTLQRRLNILKEQGRLVSSGKGAGSKYQIASPTTASYEGFQIPISNESQSIQTYVNRALDNRKAVQYNFSFLEAYQPNQTDYLSPSIRKHLKAIGSHSASIKIAGTYARKILNHLLIDLSWNSSRLEGNTYSLLETERLIELGEHSKNKSVTDTQMILNHKAAIEFLVTSEDIKYDRFTILNLHALLSDNLLGNSAACGRLRNIPVAIAKTQYAPLNTSRLISQYFQQILNATIQIQDPFEQAFFVMVHLPYLQPFEDVNKRVSRLASNIPLIQNNLSPLSFINVPEKAYIDGLLGVYELNKVDLLRDVFVWAYEQSAERYTTARQLLGEPDPFRLHYRQSLIAIIKAVVQQSLNVDESTSFIQTWVDNNIPNTDRARFREITETELLNLHVGNIARFQLSPLEFKLWSDRPDWHKIKSQKDPKL